MPFEIQSEPIPGGAELRKLVADALGSVLGAARVVAPELPLPGGPVLAVDGEGEPVLVSFDAGDAETALVNGLSAMEALCAKGGLALCMCGGMPASARPEALRLMVLAPEVPSGVALVAEGRSRVSIYTFSALRINGELSLLVEPWAAPAATAPASGGADPVHPFRTGMVDLSKEEEAFFEGL